MLSMWGLPAVLGKSRQLDSHMWAQTFIPACAAIYAGAVLAGHFFLHGVAGGFDRLWRGDVYLRGGEGIAGFILAWLVALAMWKTKGLSYGEILDAQDCVVPGAGFGIALLKVGCHVAGCCQGKVWDGPFSVRFPPGTPAYHEQVSAGLIHPGTPATLPVVPIQLMEAAFMSAVGAAFLFLFFRKKLRGVLGHVFILIIGPWRYFTENHFRGDAGRGPLWSGGITATQVMALGMMALVVGLMVDILRNRGSYFRGHP